MFAVKRPITILMATIALAVFGWQSLRLLETSLLPEMVYPKFVIITKSPGGNAEEIEQAISIPLEESLSSLPGLQDITSSSRDGLSVIEVLFHWEIDSRFTLLRIREKIDIALDRLPKGVDRPFIMDFNPGSAPIMDLVLSGPKDLNELNEIATDIIQPRFSQIDGVARAAIIGAPRPVVHIELDSKACALFNISAGDIEQSIQDNLPQQPLSSLVRVGYAEYPLIVDFPMDDPSELERLPVQNVANTPVALHDVARIYVAPLEYQSRVYRDTSQVLYVQLFKESGSNTVSATESAKELISTLKREYPDITIEIIRDQGVFVVKALNSLKRAILIGAFLAFFVIWMFLQSFRYALLLATVIPVSLLIVFNALYLHGISLNIMTLGGLALGIGLIVDNGIVLMESIFTEFQQEYSIAAIESGIKKVRRAIMGSTLTTIAIFLPIIYVKGYASILFQQQAITLTYMLLISLVAAILLLPALFRLFIFRKKTFHEKQKTHNKNKILLTLDRFFENIHEKYHVVLQRALDRSGESLIIAGSMVFCGFLAFWSVPQEYWPTFSSNQAEIKVTVPTTIPYSTIKDSTVSTMNKFYHQNEVESATARIILPAEKDVSNPQELFSSAGNTAVLFSLNLNQPLIQGSDLSQKLLTLVSLPRQDISIYQISQLGKNDDNSGKNFRIYVSGDNPKKQLESAEALRKFVATLPNCENVIIESGIKQTAKAIDINRNYLLSSSLTAEEMMADLKLHITHNEIGRWTQNLRTIPVIVFWDNLSGKDIHDVLASPLAPGVYAERNDQLFTVKNIRKFNDIRRVNRKRVVTVSASVPAQKLASTVSRTNQWISHNPSPGTMFIISSESQQMAYSFRQLMVAFFLAVIVVYLILAAQFESFIHPFNIILTVPMGMSGAFVSLLIFHQSLNVISLIGIVMLIGIGVNDAIIKVDYMNHLFHRRKMSLREAVLQTSREKFRPVIMTTLTTIVAMLPMAFGIGGNSEINQPLAITIIGGLTITTTLTLMITPVLFELSEQTIEKFRRN